MNWKALFSRGSPSGGWRLFGRATINRRLITLFVVLVSGFVLIGAAYLGVVAANRAAENVNTRINEFGVLVDRIDSGMLRARREEKDYFAQRRDEYLQTHGLAMAGVYRLIDEAQALAPDAEAHRLLDEVRTHARTYHGTFTGVADALRRAGYDDKSGLRGALQGATEQVERLLRGGQAPELTASMLRMRTIEKDYVQTGDAGLLEAMNAERDRFLKLLARASLPADTRAAVEDRIRAYHATFLGLAASFQEIAQETRAFDSVVRRIEPLLASLAQKKEQTLQQNREAQERTTQVITLLFVGVLATVTAVVSFVLFRTRRAIKQPLDRLTSTIAAITAGDKEARVRLTTGDEMQQLGDALDHMMDERGRFMQTEAENERLNNSVIAILRAVSQLGKGDLTVRVPVHEDITGALGDAINQMSENIGRTLGQASISSEQVVETSRQTREITQQSRETVLSTAQGMNEIRATIQETAKRIKRLGERSQEIGGIVKLIDTIAERTNMLALNANMQAAQAGEAGRGFMVVAAEVQRLAENAKDAAHQIEKLVGNIQMETGDTIAAMDQAIEEVVQGSELAERAATQMKRNEEMVAALDALGKRLLESVRQFKLPPEYTADVEKYVRAVA
ncbi:MAG TPA: methyl-accepting chemotaxis protein [Burkholderiales bacterium]